MLAKSLCTAVITGGNSGLGLECARSLLHDSAHGWTVVLACRDPVRAQLAVDALKAETPGAQVLTLPLDLASLTSIRAFTQELGQKLAQGILPPLHALVCNAGIQNLTPTQTADGFETTFGVNHLGHFLWVNLLLPHLASPARIAVVSSGTHDPAQKSGMPDPLWTTPRAVAHGDLGPGAAQDDPARAGRRRYSTSKLANVLFVYELARRLPAGVTVNAFDPGLMPGTGLAREAGAVLQFLWMRVLPRILPLLRLLITPNVHSVRESGTALARLIIDPQLDGVSGRYFEGMKEIRSSVDSYDLPRAKELWTASAEMTGSAA